MKPLLSGAQIREAEREIISQGVSATTLMERVGRSMAQRIAHRYRSTKDGVVILAGPGNNGGDGFVIARELFFAGFRVKTFFLPSNKPTKEYLAAKESAAKHTPLFPIDLAKGLAALDRAIERADLVIDALLGNGQRIAPEEDLTAPFNLLVEIANQAETKIAIDLPTGVDVDSGRTARQTFLASRTYTVQAPKLGLLQAPARQFCGALEIVDAGIPIDSYVDTFYGPTYRPHLRTGTDHKGRYGKVLIISGAMSGAAELAGRGALLAGSGVVRIFGATSCQTPELIISRDLEQDINWADLIIAGPGLGSDSQAGKLLSDLFLLRRQSKHQPLILDADALNLISLGLGEQIDLDNSILTPHPMEASRLVERFIPEFFSNNASTEKIRTDQIQNNRLSAAKNLARKVRSIVALKGAATVVADQTTSYINDRDAAVLAVPGSGDLLCGVIAAMLANPGAGSPFEKVAAGVRIHGICGELSAKSKATTTASEIAAQIPQALLIYLAEHRAIEDYGI